MGSQFLMKKAGWSEADSQRNLGSTLLQFAAPLLRIPENLFFFSPALKLGTRRTRLSDRKTHGAKRIHLLHLCRVCPFLFFPVCFFPPPWGRGNIKLPYTTVRLPGGLPVYPSIRLSDFLSISLSIYLSPNAPQVQTQPAEKREC